MAPTTADVAQVRQRTGAGILECRKALIEAGTLDAAVELLRTRGFKPKPDRVAAEGRIFSARDAHGAAIVELLCESDFAAGTQAFLQLGALCAESTLSGGFPMIDLEEEFAQVGAQLRETIKLRRAAVFWTCCDSQFSPGVPTTGYSTVPE